MVHLPLVWGTATVPEKQPLQSLRPLVLILEAKDVVLVGELQEVEQLGAGLHDRERRRLRVVHQDGDAAVGVEAQEPLLLLVVAHDISRAIMR